MTLTFPFRPSSVDAEFLTEDEMALAEGRHLNILYVGFSEIESAEQVALFVNRVFPNLTLSVFTSWTALLWTMGEGTRINATFVSR